MTVTNRSCDIRITEPIGVYCGVASAYETTNQFMVVRRVNLDRALLLSTDHTVPHSSKFRKIVAPKPQIPKMRIAALQTGKVNLYEFPKRHMFVRPDPAANVASNTVSEVTHTSFYFATFFAVLSIAAMIGSSFVNNIWLSHAAVVLFALSASAFAIWVTPVNEPK